MRAEWLRNGLWLVRDLASGLQGLYHPNGAYHAGDLRKAGIPLMPGLVTRI